MGPTRTKRLCVWEDGASAEAVSGFGEQVSVQEKNILIWEYAEKPDYRLGIDDVFQLYNRGPHDKNTLVESAMFVKKLLPAMLAKRVKDLQVA